MSSALEATAAELAVLENGTAQKPTRAPSTIFSGRMVSGIPADIENNAEIDAAIKILPANYSFEVKKTIWKIRQAGAKRVALQMPEGLLLYACTLADIFTRFTGAETVVMGDVTYGACCIDDFSAAALGCDMLVHYGHSCLVPIDVTTGGGVGQGQGSTHGRPPMKVLYVFVEISFDTAHLARTIAANWTGEGGVCPSRLALMGTVQFVGMLHEVMERLKDSHPGLFVPQAKPLSPGETLGCTAPKLSTAPDGQPLDALIFVADGRFHLEAALIANPGLPAFRYDPYSKRMTAEGYDHGAMDEDRRAAVMQAAAADTWGLVLGTLGRQGNPLVLQRIESAARAAGKRIVRCAMSELKPASLARFTRSGQDDKGRARTSMGAWVQVACPRLSIDWGTGFSDAVGGLPLLNSYEAHVALGLAQPWWGGNLEGTAQTAGGQASCCGGHEGCACDRPSGQCSCAPSRTSYPMDYYSRDAGPWGNYWKEGKQAGSGAGKARRAARAAAAPAADQAPAEAGAPIPTQAGH